MTADLERSADPATAGAVLERLASERPDAGARLDADGELRRRVITVAAASGWMGRLCITDPAALDVLADLDHRPPVPESPAPETGEADERAAALAGWKRLEMLRIAGRDLLGIDALEAVGSALTDLATDIVRQAIVIGPAPAGLAVIGMGKLGAGELNYASDIDLLLVGAGDVRPALEVMRQSWRVDLDLRPEGRSGPLTRTLASYEAYWDRWAETWEFQALLKARPIAGDSDLGAAFADAAQRVWRRPFGADELRNVRHLKARAEGEVARAGLSDREVKRGRGGIRDIEFAVQLLQLVHGRADPALRTPATFDALRALAERGYVAPDDAEALASAYRFLRTVEHRLQLWEDQQVHAVPADGVARRRLARVLGFRDTPAQSAVAAFDRRLVAHQAAVRAIHERLFFRPLLEAFTTPIPPDGGDGRLPAGAVAERLAAFGFSDAERTRQAVQELTARPDPLLRADGPTPALAARLAVAVPRP